MNKKNSILFNKALVLTEKNIRDLVTLLDKTLDIQQGLISMFTYDGDSPPFDLVTRDKFYEQLSNLFEYENKGKERIEELTIFVSSSKGNVRLDFNQPDNVACKVQLNISHVEKFAYLKHEIKVWLEQSKYKFWIIESMFQIFIKIIQFISITYSIIYSLYQCSYGSSIGTQTQKPSILVFTATLVIAIIIFGLLYGIYRFVKYLIPKVVFSWGYQDKVQQIKSNVGVGIVTLIFTSIIGTVIGFFVTRILETVF